MATLTKSSYSVPTGSKELTYTMPQVNTKASSYSVPTGAVASAASNYYSAGTAARKVQPKPQYTKGSAAPAYEPEKIRKAKEEYKENIRLVVENRVESQRLDGREFSFGQIAAVTAAAALFLVLCCVFLYSSFTLSQTRNRVANLKSSYQKVFAENTLTKSRIEDNIDYASVYVYATETLGMQLPEKHQVITYEKAGTEYVNKDAEIPNE